MNGRCRLLPVAVCALMVVASTVAAQDSAKVGYIDIMRLIQESKMGEIARKNMAKLQEEKQTLIASQQRDVQEMEASLNKDGAKLRPTERQEKVEQLQRAYKELQRMTEDAKEELQRQDGKLVALILENADAALKKVAKQNGYAIILKDANAIGYLDPSVNITDLVLQEVNKK